MPTGNVSRKKKKRKLEWSPVDNSKKKKKKEQLGEGHNAWPYTKHGGRNTVHNWNFNIGMY